MKKYVVDLTVKENLRLNSGYHLLKLSNDSKLPEMLPGQFAEIKVEGSPNTFLRRPISINYVDREKNEVWFLIQIVGEGTRQLATLNPGNLLNVIYPLGNSFSLPATKEENVLLIGGGVGIAPLLFLGQYLKQQSYKSISFLLGARSAEDLLQINEFKSFGEVYMTTEDGSQGEKGYVTQHSVLKKKDFDRIYTCGPKPMMVAIASYAKTHGIACEVSLENMMACGIGACLCCVEKTSEGNVCICKEGPVFNIEKLTWQI